MPPTFTLLAAIAGAGMVNPRADIARHRLSISRMTWLLV
jgi:hypothetical protein